MRYAFSKALLKIAKKDNKVIFLTGDLGFNTFETLQKNLKNRFINAGIAEQNMVTAAAGLAYTGLKPWIYSITPFVTIKVLEQLRNDICFSKTNVKVVGLGGGYDYEVAGPTHHNLEDVGILSALPNMQVYIPAIADDVETVVRQMYKETGPTYLRLAKARPVAIKIKKYAGCRQILKGEQITVVVLGSIVDKAIEVALELNRKDKNIDLWSICRLPLDLPQPLLDSIRKTKCLSVIEEHVAAAGLGQFISRALHLKEIPINHFIHFYAKGYLSKKTGSRDYYLKQSGLDTESIIKVLRSLLND